MAPKTNTASIVHWPDWENLQLSRWQWDFINDTSKRRILDAGRGAGKTWVLVLDALIRAHELLETRSEKFKRPGPRVVVAFVAPNKQNMKDLWTFIKALAPKPKGYTREGEKRYLVRENEKTVFLYGMSRGIEIRLYSAWNPNSMRGASVDILVCDEWAFCGYSKEKKRVNAENDKGGDEVWETILQKLINRAFCAGIVTIASTPFSNYFDDWCQQALAKEGQFGSWSFHHADALANDHLTTAQIIDIESERAVNEYKYRQERLGELHVVYPKFTAENRAFTTELIDGILIDKMPMKSKGPYAVGIDISWLGPDWLCVMVADVSLNIIVHCELHHKTDITDVLEICKRVHSQWKPRPGRFGYDATGEGKSISKLLHPDWKAEPVFFWERQKPHLVANVEMRMQHGALRIPDPEHFDFSTLPHYNSVENQDQKANFAECIAELRDYRKRTDVLPSGEKRVRYFKGDLKRDDCMDGLSVLAHVMPAIVLPSNTGTMKSKLANSFSKIWAGGGSERRAA